MGCMVIEEIFKAEKLGKKRLGVLLVLRCLGMEDAKLQVKPSSKAFQSSL